jgi:hypothetical protein
MQTANLCRMTSHSRQTAYLNNFFSDDDDSRGFYSGLDITIGNAGQRPCSCWFHRPRTSLLAAATTAQSTNLSLTNDKLAWPTAVQRPSLQRTSGFLLVTWNLTVSQELTAKKHFAVTFWCSFRSDPLRSGKQCRHTRCTYQRWRRAGPTVVGASDFGLTNVVVAYQDASGVSWRATPLVRCLQVLTASLVILATSAR